MRLLFLPDGGGPFPDPNPLLRHAMSTRAPKTEPSKAPAATGRSSAPQSRLASVAQADNRPASVAQRQLQQQIAQSPRQQQAAQLQAQIAQSPRQQQAAYALAQSTPALVQRRANRTGLPDALKAGVENLSGHSLDDVKVHYNSAKPAQLQAHAYAQGTDIHIAPGQEKHLPHEAWHVVQQKQGRVRPTMQLKGKVNVNDDAGLEKEADVMGREAMQMLGMSPGSFTPARSGHVSNTAIQRLKKSKDFKLDGVGDAGLIEKIDSFHLKRKNAETKGFSQDDAEYFEDLLKGIRSEAENNNKMDVVNDVEKELEYLFENDRLREVTDDVEQSALAHLPDEASNDKISDLSIWDPTSTLNLDDGDRVESFIKKLVEELKAPAELIGEVVNNILKYNFLSSDYAEVVKLVHPVVGLAEHIVRMATTGIQPKGAASQSQKVQTSSDIAKGNASHYFDIQKERNDGHYKESHLEPGTSSASVAVERVQDRIQTAGWVVSLARDKHADALEIIKNFITSNRKKLPDTINEINEETLDVISNSVSLMEIIGDQVRIAERDSPEKRFLRLLVSGRAHYTAMFASKDEKLADSALGKYVGKKGCASNAREIESSVPMDPRHLTHVIIPEVMNVCIDYIKKHTKLEVILVPTRVAKDFNYFDAEISKSVNPGDVLIPDYDSAINKLSFDSKPLLTHITRGPA